MRSLSIVTLFAVVCCTVTFGTVIQRKRSSSNKRIICFYANWAQYRKGRGRFLPHQIPADLCTHITYAHLQVDLTTHELVKRQRNDEFLLKELVKLKKKNPALKIIISVGGWKHEYKPRFSKMVQNERTRAIFIQSVLKWIQKTEVDGLSIDWEYPTKRGTSGPGDKHRYTLLLKELRAAFDEEERPLTLSASVSSGRKKIDTVYEHKKFIKYLDWVNVMAYALHGAWRKFAGHHTTMTGATNVEDSLNAWQEKGIPDEKINLGVATYGRTFTLKDPTNYGLGAPVTNPAHGKPGKYTRIKGALSYYEFCDQQWDHKIPSYDSKARKPYASRGDQWIGYESPRSIRSSIAYLMQKNNNRLGGIAIWKLGYDDFTGTFCHEGKFPLVNAARQGVYGIA
ncbi:chitotriosidase-1-like [Clytia hemisphaerica]|uniref:GH18 domain-containing protein n=1 Tax=Clytia hemisphaerica TaxID=252671 RepID=A0A7M5XB31_9CNID|eukprot:TCONS_00003777-protein